MSVHIVIFNFIKVVLLNMCKCCMHVAETRKIACRMGVIFSRFTEKQSEASEERETHATGEDTCLALLTRFALRSPEKRKKLSKKKNACFAG